MKKIFIPLLAVSFILLFEPSFCHAEKIYYKDGKVRQGKIISCTSKTITFEKRFDKLSGPIKIAIKDIDRIENDDGSISKYDYRSLYRDSQEYLKQKKYNEAVELYSLLLESFPDSNKIHYIRGILNHKIGRLNEAIQDYKFLIDHNAADVKIFNNLGIIYASNKEYKEALNVFDKAAKIDTNVAEVHYNLGVTYLNQRNYTQAEEQFQRVLAITPKDKDAKTGLEFIKNKTNKVEK